MSEFLSDGTDEQEILDRNLELNVKKFQNVSLVIWDGSDGGRLGIGKGCSGRSQRGCKRDSIGHTICKRDYPSSLNWSTQRN